MMKSILLLFISIFSFVTFSNAQELASGDSEKIEIRLVCTSSNKKPPLYIIKYAEEEIILDSLDTKEISEIEPKHVKKVNVLKGEKAIAKYGEEGRIGVIIITVSEDGWRRYIKAMKNTTQKLE